MSRTLIFSFCEKRKSASCFLVGGDVVLQKEKFFTRCLWIKIRMELEFEWRRKKTKKIALSLSLFIEEGNSVCLSALSQGSLGPLLRANTRIFAREERERGRERERRRRKSERERRESERERERFILLLLCVGVVSGFFDQRKREKKKKKKKKKVYRIERGRVNENKYNVFLSAQSG